MSRLIEKIPHFMMGAAALLLLAPAMLATPLSAAEPAEGLMQVDNVEKQPLVAATKRLVEAMTYVGSPLKDEDINW